MSHLLDQFRFFKRNFLNAKRENSLMDTARYVMRLVIGKTFIAVAGSMTKSCARLMASTVPALVRGKFMSKTV